MNDDQTTNRCTQVLSDQQVTATSSALLHLLFKKARLQFNTMFRKVIVVNIYICRIIVVVNDHHHQLTSMMLVVNVLIGAAGCIL